MIYTGNIIRIWRIADDSTFSPRHVILTACKQSFFLFYSTNAAKHNSIKRCFRSII